MVAFLLPILDGSINLWHLIFKNCIWVAARVSFISSTLLSLLNKFFFFEMELLNFFYCRSFSNKSSSRGFILNKQEIHDWNSWKKIRKNWRREIDRSKLNNIIPRETKLLLAFELPPIPLLPNSQHQIGSLLSKQWWCYFPYQNSFSSNPVYFIVFSLSR